MILQSLYELYQRLAADSRSGVPRQCYCMGNAAVALEITVDGELVNAVPLGSQGRKKPVPIRLIVPDRIKRSSTMIAPNFLCDTAKYFLGAEIGADERKVTGLAKECLAKTRELHRAVLRAITDEGAAAVLAFWDRWNPDEYGTNEKLALVRDVLDTGGNIVFRLAGDATFVHDRLEVMQAWEHYSNQSSGATLGQCLVTGRTGPVARLHKSISGIAGAQSTGATLVSFNIPSAESYGKKQGTNSPVSESAAFAYATALNWLTSNERHRLLIGDTTVVFWAEKAGPEEDLMLELFSGAFGTYESDGQSKADQQIVNDEKASGQVRSLLERAMRGLPVDAEMTAFDQGVRFYLLGLAPNAARLSVRFWHVDTFGRLLEKLNTHFREMSIDHREGERPISVGRLLMECAPAVDRKREKIPPTLVGALMRSILQGTAYPQSLYTAIIGRIRSDFDDPKNPKLERKINYPRAAFLKAHLTRKRRIAGGGNAKEVLREMLDPQNPNTGYQLGRLFALLEKAQQDANPGINATIKDRYYASASSTPGAVFPVLIRLAQHHLAKSDYGFLVDKQIESVMTQIKRFPAHLNLDDQGFFALGYYQQRNALYRKTEE